MKSHYILSPDPPNSQTQTVCGIRVPNAEVVFVWEGDIRDKRLMELLDENRLGQCRKCVEIIRGGLEGSYLAGVVSGRVEEVA